MPTSSYKFFPWTRQGLAASLEGPGSLDDDLPERISLPVALKLNQRELSDVQVDDLQLLGPGDVTGIDERVIVRVNPSPGDASFKPNDLPLIEFARPDFPWLFTPGAPDAEGRLQPWLCLACVEDKAGVAIHASPNLPLPVLEIGPTDDAPDVNAGAELPDPEEAWAWAHVLVTGAMGAGDTVESVNASHPERVVSRILCPRNLEPHKRYQACLVPLFESGRMAGLGEAMDTPSGDGDDDGEPTTLSFAWSPDSDRVRLPIYHYWEFRTGFEGDFESLARLLKPDIVPPEVGTRVMDMSDPGFDVPTVPVSIPGLGGAGGAGDAGTPRSNVPDWLRDLVDLPTSIPGLRVPVVRSVRLEGALRGPTPDGNPVRDENPAPLEKQIERLLEDPSAPESHGPVVGPPIYGRYHANRTDVPAEGAGDGWLRTLNLDVRHRAAAGIGGVIVRDQQEQLMASAWDQVGRIQGANQVLRQAQLSREASGSAYRRHLLPLAGSNLTEMRDELLHLTGPAHTRVTFRPVGPGASERTVRGELSGSSVPPVAVSSAFRRIARPRGPHARRAFAGEEMAGRILSRLADGSLRAAPPLNRPAVDSQLPSGAQVMDPLPGPDSLEREPETGLVPESADPGQLLDSPQSLPRDPETGSQLVTAFAPVLSELEERDDERDPPAPDLESVRDALLEKLDPERAVTDRIRARLRIPSDLGWSEDQLEPIMAAPEFPSPMYEPLKELSPDLLLPGLRYVPSDTISLVETNPEFIESYMLGLNHAMSEELLWREFLTDQRGTYFQRFWDVAGTLPGPNDPNREMPDLTPIHTWSHDPDTPLGSHLGRGRGGDVSDGPPGMAVLMIRGQLLRLYPNTMIYAVQGVWDLNEETRSPDPNATPVHPVFRGTLEPDATFLGFNLTLDELRGDPDPHLDDSSKRDAGWFFVIQGPPTEPRFGLDETLDFSDAEIGEDPADWNAIAWGDLVQKQGSEEANEQALEAMTHIRVSPDEGATSYRTPSQQSPQGADAETTWGHNSAHMAYITLQLPVRLAIHADDMLPSNSS